MYIPKREAQDLVEFPLKLTPSQTVTYITLRGLSNRGLYFWVSKIAYSYSLVKVEAFLFQ